VITNLAVLDFETPDHSMRLVSTHPGVSVSDVVDATGFELVIGAEVPASREPDDDEQAIIDRLDPNGLRHREVA
jgi:acyl CoA:acetate/3-ketoacid CoA transferase beta subunit